MAAWKLNGNLRASQLTDTLEIQSFAGLKDGSKIMSEWPKNT